MKKCTLHPPGYSMTEFVMASFVTALLLLTLFALYISCSKLMRRAAIQTWAQQQGTYATHVIQDAFRPAVSFDIYPSYTANPGLPLAPGGTGTFCTVFNMKGQTSGFYFSGTQLYMVPDVGKDSRPGKSDDIILASSVDVDSRFTFTYNQLDMFFRIFDPQDENRILFTADALITPRNVPVD